MKNKLAISIILVIITFIISSCGKETAVKSVNLEKWEIINFEEREDTPEEIDIEKIWIDRIDSKVEKDFNNLR